MVNRRQFIKGMIAGAAIAVIPLGLLPKLSRVQPDNNMTASEVKRRVDEYVSRALPLFEPVGQARGVTWVFPHSSMMTSTLVRL